MSKQELTLFNNDEFGKIRVAVENENPMFNLSDLADMLDIKDKRKLRERLDQRGVTTTPTPSEGGVQKMLYVNEPNMYRCIFLSRKENALKFQDWVFNEVLPTLRKTGEYSMKNRLKELEEENQRLLSQAPFPVCKKSITIRSFGNFLTTYTGQELGQNKVFAILRDWHYLQINDTHYNEPYQKYINNGFFELNVKDNRFVTMVTPKGQTYLSRRIIKSLKNNLLSYPLF